MKFKKWVEVVMWNIYLLALIIGVSECESNSLFFGKTIVCIVVAVLVYKLLKKYSRILEK